MASVVNNATYCESASLHIVVSFIVTIRAAIRKFDKLTIQQACTFLEDALHYRCIHHRVDEKSLCLYRVYYSRPVQWTLDITIFVLLMLAFVEYPSSLSTTSDPRQDVTAVQAPCGATESIEFVCLLILTADLVVKVYLKGKEQFKASKWLWAHVLILAVSHLDWCTSLALNCPKHIRVRRMLRPFFLLQHSSLMKKVVNCLRRTVPQVASVLLLLFMHIYFFTLFGMLLFPRPLSTNNSTATRQFTREEDTPYEGMYFHTLLDSFVNLLVLLTTANNPDVTMPAYNMNRFYAVYFILYLSIGLYCFMNMLTAVVYNQFRGYFMDSMQASLFRRRLAVRTAYEVLKRYSWKTSSLVEQGVPVSLLRPVILQSKLKEPYQKLIIQELDDNMGGVLNGAQFQEIFSILEMSLKSDQAPEIVEARHLCLQVIQRLAAHRYFTHFGCLIALINVICISVELMMEYDTIQTSNHTILGALNLVFVLYYLLEQSLRLWALGWRAYTWQIANVFDGVITVLLVIVEVVYVGIFGIPFWENEEGGVDNPVTLWDLVRVINMLIMIRLFRIVTQIKPMLVVVRTIVDLFKNLKSFLGVLVVIFYTYALIGIEIFHGKIPVPGNITAYECGTYEQLNYWANNFNDFASAIIVLWDVMIVNNWHVFLDAYSRYMNKWSQLYFIIWWLLSVVVIMNLFTALILENFIMRWDKWKQNRDLQVSADHVYTRDMTIHEMFREGLKEPTEEELLVELRHHAHLNLYS